MNRVRIQPTADRQDWNRGLVRRDPCELGSCRSHLAAASVRVATQACLMDGIAGPEGLRARQLLRRRARRQQESGSAGRLEEDGDPAAETSAFAAERDIRHRGEFSPQNTGAFHRRQPNPVAESPVTTLIAVMLPSCCGIGRPGNENLASLRGSVTRGGQLSIVGNGALRLGESIETITSGTDETTDEFGPCAPRLGSAAGDCQCARRSIACSLALGPRRCASVSNGTRGRVLRRAIAPSGNTQQQRTEEHRHQQGAQMEPLVVLIPPGR